MYIINTGEKELTHESHLILNHNQKDYDVSSLQPLILNS
jgi:hypothetical protein